MPARPCWVIKPLTQHLKGHQRTVCLQQLAVFLRAFTEWCVNLCSLGGKDLMLWELRSKDSGFTPIPYSLSPLTPSHVLRLLLIASFTGSRITWEANRMQLVLPRFPSTWCQFVDFGEVPSPRIGSAKTNGRKTGGIAASNHWGWQPLV